MSAEKRDDLASTRSYEYGVGELDVVDTRRSLEAGQIVLIGLNTLLLLVVVGLSLGLIWITSGVWEDMGYMLEYGVCEPLSDGGIGDYSYMPSAGVIDFTDGGIDGG